MNRLRHPLEAIFLHGANVQALASYGEEIADEPEFFGLHLREMRMRRLAEMGDVHGAEWVGLCHAPDGFCEVSGAARVAHRVG